MRRFPQFESVKDACEATREAREKLQQEVGLGDLPVEVIDHLTELNGIIGGLVELSTVELRKKRFQQ